MKYNLAKYRRTYSDTGPFKPVTEAELQLLVDGDLDTVGISVSSETLGLICDLGSRYRLASLRYYRSEPDAETISIWGRQGDVVEFDWEPIPVTTVSGSYIEADVESINSRFHQIKIHHNVSDGTSVVYELEIRASNKEVKFGLDGVFEKLSVDSGQCTTAIEPIPIYNASSASQDFYVLLEADDPDSSEVYTATTSSGDFAGVYERGLSVPYDFAWGNGHFVDTLTSGTSVALASGTLTGKYYTPVIDISALEGQRFFWQAALSGTSIIDSASVDSVVTAEIRLHNETPTTSGWVSGDLAFDVNWDIDTGTIPFVAIDNNHIFSANYFNYFQACVTLNTQVAWETPLLDKVGVEEALVVQVPAHQNKDIYLRSLYNSHYFGRETGLLVWFFEPRNEEQ